MEKIKINISETVNQILKKDTELFGFFKSDDTLNQNLFLNTLIKNYYNRILEEEDNNIFNIKKIIKENTNLNDKTIDLLSISISDYIKDKDFNDEKFNVSISLKPTKLSEEAFNNIEYSLKNKCYSKYFRMLFTEYSKKPQYLREQIIFSDKVEIINQCIKEKRKLKLEINNKEYTVMPYALLNGGEELFNYLLCYYEEKSRSYSYRLSNIKGLVKTNELFEINDDIKKEFENIISYGVQYACGSNNIIECIVELTEAGMRKFKRIYIHRPKLLKKEGNRYYFKASYDQLYQYFFRFGSDAYIVSPSKLSKSIKEEYYVAGKHYKERFNELKDEKK